MNNSISRGLLFLAISLLASSFAHFKSKIHKSSSAQDQNADFNELVYKFVKGDTLKMRAYQPANFEASKTYPSIIFFFGGGWKGGDVSQFQEQAKYFASRNMMVFLADYRVEKRHQTTPFDAVRDAKSAIRYLKKHSTKLRIDSNKIVAAGGSAGGHLAAATTMLPGLNESSDDLSIATTVTALVLFNPVIDNSKEGYGYERIGERYPEISPLHNINSKVPPTIFFLGTNDKLIPVATAKSYKAKIEAVGGRCDLHLYKDQAHGFFNSWKEDKTYYRETLRETDKFLLSLGLLNGDPTI